MSDKLSKNGPDEVIKQFHINPGASFGMYVTLGTQVLLQLSFCRDTHSQAVIIDDVMKKLGIKPEDIIMMRSHDEVLYNDLDAPTPKYSWDSESSDREEPEDIVVEKILNRSTRPDYTAKEDDWYEHKIITRKPVQDLLIIEYTNG